MSLVNEKYLSLTTFKKDGTAKPTPVWIVDAGDGKLAFTTASSSWKIKRIRNGGTVRLQPSDSKGKVTEGSDEVSGNAVVVQGEEFLKIRDLVKAKYGVQLAIVRFLGKVQKMLGKASGLDAAVIITLDD